MQGHKPTTTKARRFSTAQGPSNDGKQYIMPSASIQREGYLCNVATRGTKCRAWRQDDLREEPIGFQVERGYSMF